MRASVLAVLVILSPTAAFAGGKTSGNNGGKSTGNNGGKTSSNNGGKATGNNGGKTSSNNGGKSTSQNGGKSSGNNGNGDLVFLMNTEFRDYLFDNVWSQQNLDNFITAFASGSATRDSVCTWDMGVALNRFIEHAYATWGHATGFSLNLKSKCPIGSEANTYLGDYTFPAKNYGMFPQIASTKVYQTGTARAAVLALSMMAEINEVNSPNRFPYTAEPTLNPLSFAGPAGPVTNYRAGLAGPDGVAPHDTPVFGDGHTGIPDSDTWYGLQDFRVYEPNGGATTFDISVNGSVYVRLCAGIYGCWDANTFTTVPFYTPDPIAEAPGPASFRVTLLPGVYSLRVANLGRSADRTGAVYNQLGSLRATVTKVSGPGAASVEERDLFIYPELVFWHEGAYLEKGTNILRDAACTSPGVRRDSRGKIAVRVQTPGGGMCNIMDNQGPLSSQFKMALSDAMWQGIVVQKQASYPAAYSRMSSTYFNGSAQIFAKFLDPQSAPASTYCGSPEFFPFGSTSAGRGYQSCNANGGRVLTVLLSDVCGSTGYDGVMAGPTALQQTLGTADYQKCKATVATMPHLPNERPNIESPTQRERAVNLAQLYQASLSSVLWGWAYLNTAFRDGYPLDTFAEDTGPVEYTYSNFWNGFVSHTGDGVGSWARLDLGTARNVSIIKVWYRTDYWANYEMHHYIQTSMDGVNWTTQFEQDYTQADLQAEGPGNFVLALTNPAYARYVRMFTPNYTQVSEIRAYGMPAANGGFTGYAN